LLLPGPRGGLHKEYNLAGRYAGAVGNGRCGGGELFAPAEARGQVLEVRLDFLDRLLCQHRRAGPRRNRRHAQAEQVTHDVVHQIVAFRSAKVALLSRSERRQ
jgi:hypothetical protein